MKKHRLGLVRSERFVHISPHCANTFTLAAIIMFNLSTYVMKNPPAPADGLCIVGKATLLHFHPKRINSTSLTDSFTFAGNTFSANSHVSLPIFSFKLHCTNTGF